MPCILNIDTATTVCSVAISNDGTVLFDREDLNGSSHARQLGVFVAEALAFVREKGLKLDAVAVSCGPGSYTGLRIGVSEAKGICYGLGIPLIAITTPLVMAEKVSKTVQIADNCLLCPMIDARRMEVYAALYDTQLKEIRAIAADIVDETTYQMYLDSSAVIFFGNGSDKCKELIKSDNALFIDGVYPSAKYMVRLAEDLFKEKKFEDIAYFEPLYLKDFVATTPRKNILG